MYYAEFTFAVLLFVFLHLLACVWYKIGTLQKHGWVDNYGLDADGLRRDLYWPSFYWSVTQLHGGSNIYPCTTVEYVFAAGTVFSCFVLFTRFSNR